MRRSVARHHLLVSSTVILLGCVTALSTFWLLSTSPFFKTTLPQINPPSATTSTTYLQEEEAVVIPTDATSSTSEVLLLEPVPFTYIEVINSCGSHYEGECLNVRAGPGTEFKTLNHLRNGIVLKVDGQVTRGTTTWYRITFDELLRYPERVTSDWYVAADYVRTLTADGTATVWDKDATIATTSKHIVVHTSTQRLTAYDGDEVFMDIPISTGRSLTPTPKGTFTVYKKTPSRYMQGPLPGLPNDQYYDMPGVPWNLYFTYGGAVIHGTYWHDSFGSPYSHGCVNLPVTDARTLYNWTPLGTPVTVL